MANLFIILLGFFLCTSSTFCLEILRRLEENSLINTCRKIKNKQFQNECIKISQFHSSSSIVSNATFVSEEISVKKSVDTCPSLEEVKNSESVNLRSPSPWMFMQNYNRQRFPMIIREAKCLCEGCLDPITGKESEHLVSKPVTVDVPVLRILRRGASFEECTKRLCRSEVMPVAVACFCAFK